MIQYRSRIPKHYSWNSEPFIFKCCPTISNVLFKYHILTKLDPNIKQFFVNK